MKKVVAIALAVCVSASGYGGTIKLKDGSTIYGGISLIRYGRVEVNTSIGKLRIPIHKVETMATKKALWFAYDKTGKTRELSPVDYSNGLYRIGRGSSKAVEKRIAAAWDKSQADPFLRRWKHEISFYYSARSGNVDSEYSGGGFRSRLEGPVDRLKLYATAMQSSYNERKTRDEQNAGIDYEWDIDRYNSFYCLVKFEHDDVEGVELRQSYGTGYGHYFLREPHHQFRTRLGIQYRNELYDDDTRWEGPALDLGLLHSYRKGLIGKVSTEISYSPTIQPTNGGQLLHQETSWDLPISVQYWRLRLGMKNDYNEKPPVNKEHLDTQYYARVVFSW